MTKLFLDFDFSRLDSPDFKEDSVREVLILPLLYELGYEELHIVRSKSLKHPFVNIGSQKRRVTLVPDYLLKVENTYAWVLDAKAPNQEIITGENVEQVYSYSIHPDIRTKYFALCNGRKFSLFQQDRKEPILDFELRNIADYWDKLTDYLSPNSFPKIENKPLEQPNEFYLKNNETLLQLGSKIIFTACSKITNSNYWVFKLKNPIKGNLDMLKEYILNFKAFDESESFVIYEYLGDARTITELSLENESKTLTINVNNKLTPTNPNKFGKTLTPEVLILNGLDAAKHRLGECLGVIKGENADIYNHGSLATFYYHEYKDNLPLLSKLLKLEMIRLSLIPLRGKPPLLFVERFLDVNVQSNELINSHLKVDVSLKWQDDWGNIVEWSGAIKVFILDETNHNKNISDKTYLNNKSKTHQKNMMQSCIKTNLINDNKLAE
jgi:hypothetical protein